MEPEGDYAAVLLMDGEQIFGRTGLRSDEMGELHWLKAANKVVPGGTLYVSLPLEHPLSQSLIRGSSGARYLQLLREREEAHLPPNFRLIAIEGEPKEISQASDFLHQEQQADEVEYLGPLDVAPQKSRLVVKFPVESGNRTVRLIHEFNRVRSLQGQGVLRVSVDPLDFI
jgi:primosomal protein N' (replication factor Y)